MGNLVQLPQVTCTHQRWELNYFDLNRDPLRNTLRGYAGASANNNLMACQYDFNSAI